MHRHPYELEIEARYARERVAALAETSRPTPKTTTLRPATPSPALAWLLRGTGRCLIAIGERLAGMAAGRPAPVG